ncbi:hypothetical protein KFU94_00550 [Chloroflexi bacterium TSY]|nr:hypothetical protein [Chloroflexi bacterium TSY]
MTVRQGMQAPVRYAQDGSGTVQIDQELLMALLAGGGASAGSANAAMVQGGYQQRMVPQQWGCCEPLFGECVDDEVMTLFQGLDAVEPALRWFGFRRAEKRYVRKAYLTYAAPAGASQGMPNAGIPDTICGPGQKVEVGKPCYIEFCGFGEIRLCSYELKDGGNSIPWCDERDVYTLDFGEGAQRIEKDEEWWLAILSSQMMEHIAGRLLVGDNATLFRNSAIPADSDGLLQLLTQDYSCVGNPSVIDWGGNAVCDYESATTPTGATLNGQAITGNRYARNLYVTLREVFRQNVRKFRMTRMLSGTTNLQPGDVAILMPEWLKECLIECAICHVICRDDYTRRDSEMAAMKYQEWITGGEGFGVLWFDGFPVPILPYNPVDYTTYDPLNPDLGMRGLMEKADGTANMLMLWRGVGGNAGRRFLIPEYNDLSDGLKDTAANGQFQLWIDDCGRCYTLNMATEWRWYLDFPCVQTLITNVACDAKFELCTYPTELDPLDTDCASGSEVTVGTVTVSRT